MLDATLKTQLKAYLERVTQPIELVASLDDRPASAEMRELLESIAGLSDQIALRLDGQDARRPSFSISALATPFKSPYWNCRDSMSLSIGALSTRSLMR